MHPPAPALSPGAIARLAGVLYQVIIVTAGFAAVMREQIDVAGDAAATAANILAPEGLNRLSFATLLWPTYPPEISQLIVIQVGLAEVPVPVWLVAKGMTGYKGAADAPAH